MDPFSALPEADRKPSTVALCLVAHGYSSRTSGRGLKTNIDRLRPRIQGILYFNGRCSKNLGGFLAANGTGCREISFLVQECVHSLHNRTDVGLCTGSANPHPSGSLSQLFGEMNRDHEDWDVRKQLRDLLGDIEPVQIRHLEVEQNHVGEHFLYSLQRFPSCPCLVAHSPTALLLEDSAEIVSHRRVVVYHKNSNQAKRPSFLFRFKSPRGRRHDATFKRSQLLCSVTVASRPLGAFPDGCSYWRHSFVLTPRPRMCFPTGIMCSATWPPQQP